MMSSNVVYSGSSSLDFDSVYSLYFHQVSDSHQKSFRNIGVMTHARTLGSDLGFITSYVFFLLVHP